VDITGDPGAFARALRLVGQAPPANPMLIKRGLDKAVEAVVAEVEAMSVPVNGKGNILAPDPLPAASSKALRTVSTFARRVPVV
jgi:chaperonin GroEL (HSP60 family)